MHLQVHAFLIHLVDGHLKRPSRLKKTFQDHLRQKILAKKLFRIISNHLEVIFKPSSPCLMVLLILVSFLLSYKLVSESSPIKPNNNNIIRIIKTQLRYLSIKSFIPLP